MFPDLLPNLLSGMAHLYAMPSIFSHNDFLLSLSDQGEHHCICICVSLQKYGQLITQSATSRIMTCYLTKVSTLVWKVQRPTNVRAITSNLYCRHLELDEYNDISEGRRDHRSEGAFLDVKVTQSSQGSNAFNFLKDIWIGSNWLNWHYCRARLLYQGQLTDLEWTSQLEPQY